MRRERGVGVKRWVKSGPVSGGAETWRLGGCGERLCYSSRMLFVSAGCGGAMMGFLHAAALSYTPRCRPRWVGEPPPPPPSSDGLHTRPEAPHRPLPQGALPPRYRSGCPRLPPCPRLGCKAEGVAFPRLRDPSPTHSLRHICFHFRKGSPKRPRTLRLLTQPSLPALLPCWMYLFPQHSRPEPTRQRHARPLAKWVVRGYEPLPAPVWHGYSCLLGAAS